VKVTRATVPAVRPPLPVLFIVERPQEAVGFVDERLNALARRVDRRSPHGGANDKIRHGCRSRGDSEPHERPLKSEVRLLGFGRRAVFGGGNGTGHALPFAVRRR